MKQHPTFLTALGLILLLTVPLTFTPAVTAGASCPQSRAVETGMLHPVNPLVNADFEYGLTTAMDTREPLLNAVLTAVGSAAPGLTENRSEVVAPGWTLRPYSGNGFPHTSMRWSPHSGPAARINPQARDGAVTVTYNAQDSGPGTPILTQAVGQRPMVGLVSTPKEIALWISSLTPEKPLKVVVGVYVAGDPAPYFSSKEWQPGKTTRFEHVTFPFPEAAGSVTQVFIAFVGVNEQSHGARVVVDGITVGAVTLRPEVSPCFYASGFPWTYLP